MDYRTANALGNPVGPPRGLKDVDPRAAKVMGRFNQGTELPIERIRRLNSTLTFLKDIACSR